jgi:hypothetical protein
MMEEHGSFNRRAVDVIGGWSDSPDRVEFMGTGVGPYLAEGNRDAEARDFGRLR